MSFPGILLLIASKPGIILLPGRIVHEVGDIAKFSNAFEVVINLPFGKEVEFQQTVIGRKIKAVITVTGAFPSIRNASYT